MNRLKAIHEFRSFVAVGRNGEPLAPAGSARDLFLNIKPEFLEKAQSSLANLLAGRAEVLPASELINQGFFGAATSPVSRVFLERVGNLVVLPYAGESAYWYVRGKFGQTFHGHHGGLTRDEMEIPLVACGF